MNRLWVPLSKGWKGRVKKVIFKNKLIARRRNTFVTFSLTGFTILSGGGGDAFKSQRPGPKRKIRLFYFESRNHSDDGHEDRRINENMACC
jgi:hypothetical protein